jgi:hypothetical protein
MRKVLPVEWRLPKIESISLGVNLLLSVPVRHIGFVFRAQIKSRR